MKSNRYLASPFARLVQIPLVMMFLLFCSNISAQEKGVVKFIIDNENGYFEILVNDTLVIKQFRDSLPAGIYKAQAWSQGYDIKDFEFTVNPGQVTDAYVKLDRSTAYQAYTQSYHNYRMKFHKSVTLPVTTTLALGITGTVFMIKAYDAQNKIKLELDSYYQSSNTTEIEDIKATIADDNARYNRMRTGFYVSAGLTTLGVFTTIYTSIRFRNHNTEPTYSKQSPFNNKMSMQFTPYGYSLIFRIG